MLNVNMDISPRIIQKVEFVFHSQTIFNLHIVINMFVNLHYVVKFLLIDIFMHIKIQSYFETTIVFHYEMVCFVKKKNLNASLLCTG